MMHWSAEAAMFPDMSFSMSFTWFIFEMAGIAAFSISGALVGISKKMDIFGIIILAVMTAVGGGILRDILAGIFPPSILNDPTGLFLSIATAIIVFIMYEVTHLSHTSKKALLYLYHFSDTIGLAAFTVTGTATALSKFPESSAILPITLGLLTAVGGGILRDIMAQRIPAVFRVDIYALASVFGASATCCTWTYTGDVSASWIGFASVIILRVLAIRYHWQLPHPHRSEKSQS